MSTLDDAAAFANNPALVGPLQIAIATSAINIMNEDPTTDHHEQRVELAKQILHSPQHQMERFRHAVATNQTIIAHDDMDTALNDLQFVVDSVYNALAGIATQTSGEPSGEE